MLHTKRYACVKRDALGRRMHLPFKSGELLLQHTVGVFVEEKDLLTSRKKEGKKKLKNPSSPDRLGLTFDRWHGGG